MGMDVSRVTDLKELDNNKLFNIINGSDSESFNEHYAITQKEEERLYQQAVLQYHLLKYQFPPKSELFSTSYNQHIRRTYEELEKEFKLELLKYEMHTFKFPCSSSSSYSSHRRNTLDLCYEFLNYLDINRNLR